MYDECRSCVLRLPIACGGVETILARGKVPSGLLDELARLLGLETEESVSPVPEPAVTLVSEPYEEEKSLPPFNGKNYLRWDEKSLKFFIRFRKEPEHTENEKHYILMTAFHLAILRRILAGTSIAMHGALLLHPKFNRSVVIFGESGMGKSTASNRFSSQGGRVMADDRLLLTFSPDGKIFAQGLPTWSRFSERFSVNFSETKELGALSMLYRGADDEIKPAPKVNWDIALYQSISDITYVPQDFMPDALRLKSIKLSSDRAEELRKRFPMIQIMGDLNGHIFDHLTKLLENGGKL